MNNINWIECNLPWNNESNESYINWKNLQPKYPKDEADKLVKEKFGLTYDEINSVVTPLSVISNFENLQYNFSYEKNLKELLTLTSDPDLIKFIRHKILLQEILEFEDSLPIVQQYSEQYDLAYNEYEKSCKENISKNFFPTLAKSGTLIELESGKVLLIGDINEEGGVCNDCLGINKSDIIKRYAVIYSK